MDRSSERSPLVKVHYRPIEAAIRWAHLWEHERQILDSLQLRSLPDTDGFPQWPALRRNAERIYDALLNGELPYGIDGAPASPNTPIDHPKLTIRHVALRAWMRRYYPDQRPRFLFGKAERHPGITVEAARTLTYERDWFKSLVTERDNEITALRTELHALLKSLDSDARRKPSTRGLSARAERVYLHIIGGQLELLLNEEQPGKAHRKFRTQEEVIAALTDLYGRRLGITKSTLESKFALANRMLSDRS